jgi:hypothetical protein
MSIFDLTLKAAVMLSCLLFAGGLYSFALILLKVPSSKTTSAIRAIGARNRPSPDGISQMYDSVSLFVSQILPMSEYRQQQMEQNLKIAHISMSPKLYEARAIVKAAAYALLAIPVYGLGVLVTMSFDNAYIKAFPAVAAVLIVVVGILQYTNAHEKITEAIKMKREQIDMDLPRFVNAISQEIQTEHNVLAILEKHKDSFSDYFREELEITIADMRSSNWEAALTRFEGRIGSTQLSEVTRGLVEMVRGDNTNVYWENLSIRFSEYGKQQLRAQALKIPPKVNRMSMILLMIMLLLYVVVLGTTMMESMSTLFSAY